MNSNTNNTKKSMKEVRWGEILSKLLQDNASLAKARKAAAQAAKLEDSRKAVLAAQAALEERQSALRAEKAAAVAAAKAPEKALKAAARQALEDGDFAALMAMGAYSRTNKR